MSTAKENKLKEIKSEILEITEFVASNKKDKISDIHIDNDIETDLSDTFTLTNIVSNEKKVHTKNDLAEIKKELCTLKSMLIKQKLLLEEILLKIK